MVMRLRKEKQRNNKRPYILSFYSFFLTATFDKYLIVLNMPEQERNSFLPFKVVFKISLTHATCTFPPAM